MNHIKSYELPASSMKGCAAKLTVHELKTAPIFFEQVLNGTKPFEVRFDDRNFRIGDTLWLLEYDCEKGCYTGRECTAVVTSILNDAAFCKDGYVVLGFKPVAKALAKSQFERGRQEVETLWQGGGGDRPARLVLEFVSFVESEKDGSLRQRELAARFLHKKGALTVHPIFGASALLRLVNEFVNKRGGQPNG